MRMMRFYAVIFWGIMVWTGMAVRAQGYTVSPDVPDFTELHAGCVVATYGNTRDPFLYEGIVEDRHKIITAQGKDFYTGGELQWLPPGESKVIKLGNEQVGSEAESITYHFIVDPEKAVLLLKFAVVFVDPSHSLNNQPRFVVRIMDKDGNLIDACAEYDVSARDGIDGFRTYDKIGLPIRWRDWTSVGLDMSAYAGQEVQVQFVTYDCALSGHFGYAYFTASCISHKLSLDACDGTQFTIAAPTGFSSYMWQDGQTASAVTYTQEDGEKEIACEITSATGCRFTLSAHVTADPVLPDEKVFFDTICQGESYKKNNYNLPAQWKIGTFNYLNTYFSTATCGEVGELMLHLTVLQRYYPVEAELCPGESFVDYGFSYVNPASGEYRDTLTYTSSSGMCDSVVTLYLLVYPEVKLTSDIAGEKYPCAGTTQTYKISESWTMGQYVWEFPPGFDILSGQGTTQVTVQVMDFAETGPVRLLYGKGACATSPDPYIVNPHGAYWQTVIDTLCTGTEYHENGFDVPIQDCPGFLTFAKRGRTVYGCDSVVTLHLYVYETPEVTLKTSDSVICQGGEVELQAWGSRTKYIPPEPPAVSIGDIFCEDGTIVKLKEYAAGNKKAQGIVFYVDSSGEHGWVVHIKHQSKSCKWGINTYNIPDLPDYYYYSNSRLDTAGYFNTSQIRQAGNEVVYPAAYSVDFTDGWYLPAIGQLLRMYGYLDEINKVLEEVGGEIFEFVDTQWFYWSSSEGGTGQAWGLEVRGRQMLGDKAALSGVRVRAVRSF